MSLRRIERESIVLFLTRNRDRIHGRVLDYGAGKQPYRPLIEATGAEYTPFDDPRFPGSTAEETSGWPVGEFDTVVCTQVLQYVDSPRATLDAIRYLLAAGGWLLMTGPTNWPIVEQTDLRRFTPSGMLRLLQRQGFRDVVVTERAHVTFENERWALGWQAIARV